jgi:RNA polymerase sigma-70 factor, ECF subfamily
MTPNAAPGTEEVSTPPAEASESALIARLRAGEEEAYEEVSREYAGRLYAMAYRMLHQEQDAQDAVQEGMMGAFRAIGTFDERSKLSTWMTRIVINKCLMKLRSKRRKPERSIEGLLPTFLDDGHPTKWTSHWRDDDRGLGGGGISQELKQLVREKIEELPEQYREVLLLRDFQQLSTEDVAQALGDTANAVKVRLHRARQALRALLDPYMSREEA